MDYNPPYFVLNTQQLLQQYQLLEPHVDTILYSTKTNPTIASVLAQHTSCQFSVHSLKMLSTLSDPTRAVFFVNAHTLEQLTQALTLGIQHFVIDNQQDAHTVKQLFTQNTTPLTLSFRLKLKEYTIKTGKYYVFGLSQQTVSTLIDEFSQFSHITLGLHVHRKTQNISEWTLYGELNTLLKQHKNKLSFVNIGGGLPVAYANYKTVSYKHIFHELALLRAFLHQHNMKLLAEPGRFLAAPPISLHTHVLRVENTTIIINASVYNCAMDTFIAHIKLPVQGEASQGTAYTIKGCTPDSSDIFRYKVFFSSPPQVGDEIIFTHAGAYNFSTTFCSLVQPETRIQ